jgi:hypothetical protein
MLANFSGSVIDTGGRTVDVQPDRQIVEPIVLCVTGRVHRARSAARVGPRVEPIAIREQECKAKAKRRLHTRRFLTLLSRRSSSRSAGRLRLCIQAACPRILRGHIRRRR